MAAGHEAAARESKSELNKVDGRAENVSACRYICALDDPKKHHNIDQGKDKKLPSPVDAF